MKFTTATALSVLAFGKAMASEAITIKVPAGLGANGTIIIDQQQATQYLQGEAGVAFEKFLHYAQTELNLPQAGVEYQFPAGSGLEQSSVVFDKDAAPDAKQDGVDMSDCDRCWISCLILAWFPPAWGLCMAACASKGCVPSHAA